VKRIRNIILIIAVCLFSAEVFGQNLNLNTDAKTLTYEELYDNPYDINKLFIHLQPVYGEMFATNSTVGMGLEAQYYMKNVADFKASARTAYSKKFDLMREAATNNSTVDNNPRSYNYYDLVGTYHIIDREEDSETKFILYSKRYKGDKWAATVPLHTVIPTKMRRIYGARLGGMYYTSSLNYDRIMEKQGVTIYNQGGVPIGEDESVYGDLSVAGIFLGGSMTLIKNVAVQPDKIYGTLVNDLIFTAYLDIAFAPVINIDDIYLDNDVYSSETLSKSMIGFRAGFDGKFNREISWGYNGEIGYRPGLKKSGLYVLVKISFPVFSTQLRYQVESFGK
jgi:drug/metabolite transporter superfamily protein YnfA